MALHVMLFSLAEYDMCSRLFILLHLQYLDLLLRLGEL
jgi:hypothetical protein